MYCDVTQGWFNVERLEGSKPLKYGEYNSPSGVFLSVSASVSLHTHTQTHTHSYLVGWLVGFMHVNSGWVI